MYFYILFYNVFHSAIYGRDVSL